MTGPAALLLFVAIAGGSAGGQSAALARDVAVDPAPWHAASPIDGQRAIGEPA